MANHHDAVGTILPHGLSQVDQSHQHAIIKGVMVSGMLSLIDRRIQHPTFRAQHKILLSNSVTCLLLFNIVNRS
jgi:hypothetical protein